MTTIQPRTSSARSTTGRREQIATRAVFLIAGTAMAAWAPLVPFAKTHLGVADGAFGLLLLCLGLGSMIAMPLTGALVNRFGCRALIVAGATMLIFVLPCLALANTIPELAIALALFGASVGTVDVAMNVQAVIVEQDSDKSMMSGFHGLFSVGGIAGAGGVSLLLSVGVSPLEATMVASGLLVALLFFAFVGLLPYGSREVADDAPFFVMPKGIVIFIGLLCFIVFLSEGAVLDWSALFLIEGYSVDQAHAGLGYTVFSIAMTTGRLVGDWIVKTLGGVKVIVFGGLLAALGFLLAIFASLPVLAFVGFGLVGFGASNMVPVFFTAAGKQKDMPASLAVAAVTTLGYAGILVGPAMIGFVAQHFSLGAGFVMIALGLIFAAMSGLFLDRK